MKPALVVLLPLIAITACGSPPATSHTPSPSPSATPAPTATPTVAPTPTPLPVFNAPAIIQVENSPEGRPQSGLGQADMVYEYVAEGGVGRFSLFFFHLPTPAQMIGPVRSARTVTVQLLSQYQGYLAYSGSDAYVAGLLHASGQPYYNETTANGNLFRIDTRSPPHNLYTNEANIGALAAAAARPPVGYQLFPRTLSAPPGGTPIGGFYADISSDEQPHFQWSAQLGGFTRREDTGPVLDPDSGAPLVVPTVIVQQVEETTDYNVVDVLGHYGVDEHITGTGPAQVFTDGQEYNATWTQPAHGPPNYTLANGQPAPVWPGEVWICLVPVGSPAVLGP